MRAARRHIVARKYGASFGMKEAPGFAPEATVERPRQLPLYSIKTSVLACIRRLMIMLLLYMAKQSSDVFLRLVQVGGEDGPGAIIG
jgi:hypothetical protein